MTDEQINCAIAEACGWRKVTDDPNYKPYWECTKTGRMVAATYSKFPSYDYCNDLNAMHEAEKVLNKNQIDHFLKLLRPMEWGWWWAVHATARQRAEAFLRTLGKWEVAK